MNRLSKLIFLELPTRDKPQVVRPYRYFAVGSAC